MRTTSRFFRLCTMLIIAITLSFAFLYVSFASAYINGESVFPKFESSLFSSNHLCQDTFSSKVQGNCPVIFSDTASNGVFVYVTASVDAFPQGTTMRTSAVSESTARKAITGSLNNITGIKAIDITFYDASGLEIQPAENAKVNVRLSLGSSITGDDYYVLHIADGNATIVNSASASCDGASFVAQSFSIYAIAGIEEQTTITYEFYNDDGTFLASEILVDGDTLTAPETPVSAVNSTTSFIGWSTTAEPTNYITFGTISVPSGSDQTIQVYARYDPSYQIVFHNQYDVILQSFSETEGSSFVIADHNSDITFPVPDNMAVVGWSTSKSNTSSTEPGLGDEANAVTSIASISADVHLYPILKEATYLTYVCNGGTYYAPDYYLVGETTVSPGTPTYDGYTFEGWYTDSSFSSTFSFGSTLSSNTTIYAKWTAHTDTPYLVVYWGENADDTDYSYLGSVSLTGTTDTMTAITESTASIVDLSLYTLHSAIEQQNIDGSGDTIVNVYYDRNVYSLVFYTAASHGTANEPDVEITDLRIEAKWGADISDLWPKVLDPDTYPYSWYVGDDSDVRQPRMYTMPSSDTEYWEMSLDSATHTYYFKYYLELLDGETSTKTYDSKYFPTTPIVDLVKDQYNTMYSTHEDHYDIPGFTYMNNVTYTYNSTYGIETYLLLDFTGYNTIVFYYERNDYTITYYSSGSIINTQTVQYEADLSAYSYTPDSSYAPDTTYSFAGWYDNEYFAGDPVVLSGTMGTSNIVLYAKWEQPQYDVTFDLNGGTGSIDDQLNVYGTLLTNPDAPTRTNYAFIGWELDDKLFDIETTYIQGDVLDSAVDGVITLTAVWIGGETYALTYDAAEGTNPPVDTNVYYSSATRVELLSASDPPDGSVFKHWTNNSLSFYPGELLTISSSLIVNNVITLTAEYSEGAAITYHPNGGTGSIYTTESLSNYSSISLLAYDGATLGYSNTDGTFIEWNTMANGSGTSFSAGDAVRVSMGANVLYAIWSNTESSTVTYHANGGKGSDYVVALPVSDLSTAVLAYNSHEVDFTNYEAVFVGWNTQPDGSGTYYSVNDIITLEVGEDFHLYAIWDRIPVTGDSSIPYLLIVGLLVISFSGLAWIIVKRSKGKQS